MQDRSSRALQCSQKDRSMAGEPTHGLQGSEQQHCIYGQSGPKVC